MKVWVVMLVVSWICWTSKIVQMAATENEHELKPSTVRFTTERATRNSYMMFMRDLYTALTDRADKSGDIPVLPPPSQANDPGQYVLVELSNGAQSVTFGLNVSDANILGYQVQPGDETSRCSYFFSDVPDDVRDALFPDTRREYLSFTGGYKSLERAARVNRGGIPLGIGPLRQHIQNINTIEPRGVDDSSTIASALIVCIQMVSEAVRFRNIQQRILDVAEPGADGTYPMYFLSEQIMALENKWLAISKQIQSATFGIFPEKVRYGYEYYRSVQDAIFTIALMPLICEDTRANLQHSALPSCERVLAPTSHIMGQNGLCLEVEVLDWMTSDHPKLIVLSECEQNKITQLWTLNSVDNTIRSVDGKCLTYGYFSGNKVTIYDCNKPAFDDDAMRWEIQGDGSIRNIRSKTLILTSGKDDGYLYLDDDKHGSNQCFHAGIGTTSTVTRLVNYNGWCLRACRDSVLLKKCGNNDDVDERWALYPDGTIRPQMNKGMCLKYYYLKDVLHLDSCDGRDYERWRFTNDGTISHVAKNTVMVPIPITFPGSTVVEVTLSQRMEAYNHIWFQL